MGQAVPAPAAAGLLPTKLFIPEPGPEVISRARLLDAMGGAMHCPLILVSAPAGAGKTTLVADWLRHRDGVARWLSLDTGDDDPTIFLRYLVEALAQVDIGAAGRARTLLSLTPPAEPDAVAQALIADLAAAGTSTVLVLDDYHAVSDPGIHRIVTLLAERAPPSLTLVLVTRSDPPLPLSRLRARGQMREIRAVDLRFRPDEAAPFLAHFSERELAGEAVSTLVDRTEGWAVGLQLAALALRRSTDPGAFLAHFRGTHAFIADYLTDEVLGGIAAELQHFLVRSSLLTRMTGPLCDAALDMEGSQEVLETLSRANLFLVPLDAERRWFRYHHLFADLLRRRNSAGEADQAAVLDRAARWCEGAGALDEAAEYAVRAGSLEWAADLVARIGLEALTGGEAKKVLRWIGLLPEELVRSSPDHCILAAWTHSLMEDPVSMQVYARWADEAARSGSRPFPHIDDVGLHARINRAEADAVVAGDPVLGIRPVQEVRGEIPPGNVTLRCAGAVVEGELLALAGRHTEAIACHEEAQDLAVRMDSKHLRLSSITGTTENLLVQGRLRRTLGLLENELNNWGRETGVLGSRLGNLFAIQALAHLERDELESAEAAVARAWYGLGGRSEPAQAWRHAGRLGFASHPAMHSTGRGVLHAHAVEIGIHLRMGRWDQVSERLEGMEGAAPRLAPASRVLIEWLRVRYWLRQGDSSRLQRWSMPEVPATSSRFWDDIGALARAVGALGAHDPDSVFASLSPRVDDLNTRQAGFCLVPALILEALASRMKGSREEAAKRTDEALGLTAPEERFGPWLDVGADRAVPLLDDAIARARVSEPILAHAARVLELFRAEAEPAVDPVAGLSDRELSVLRLIAVGRTNQEISERLFLAVGTVKKHTHNIYGKLGVRNRTGAVEVARRAGLLR